MMDALDAMKANKDRLQFLIEKRVTMEYLKVNIPKPVYARLQALQHKGQTIAGVIEELLDKVAPADGSVEAVRCRLYPLPGGTWSDTPPENWATKNITAEDFEKKEEK